MLVWRPPSHADELALEPICAHTSTARKRFSEKTCGMSPLDFEKMAQRCRYKLFEFILQMLREYLGGALKKKGTQKTIHKLFEFILHKFVNI